MYNLHDILFLGPYFSPLILRAAVAIAFWVLAENFFRNRKEIAVGLYPIIKSPGMAFAHFAYIVMGIFALAIAVGFYTQIVAILGVLTALKAWIFAKRYPHVFPHGRLAYFLLGLICLALIITGAGAFAVDSPL